MDDVIDLEKQNDAAAIRTDFLIVGAGPAGASLACFLAEYGLTGIIIAAAPGTAATPRAHITNMAALECLRDIGLERECLKAASPGHNMAHTRWCKTMTGEEYARIYSWGNDPKRKGDYDAASPCNHVDLPQTLLEPILVKRAIHKGWKMRFNTALISFRRSATDRIVTEVRDELTKITYSIQSRYLFGCDGARSQIVRQLQLPLMRKPGQGLALNILVRCDLTDISKSRTGVLHWIFDPTLASPDWAWFCILRMVKPWHEWIFIVLPKPGAELDVEPRQKWDTVYMPKLREWVGDDSRSIEILDVSKWTINEIVAEHYSDGNIHCLGDAVHRHPPFNGLGSNTCIQDAYNLAWKVAFSEAGKASPNLVQTYSEERQPVGVKVITRANQGLRDHTPWMETIGMMEDDIEKRKEIIAEFEDASDRGKARRAAFWSGIANTATEFHAVGIEMNELYASGAVYNKDESGPPPQPDHEIFKYKISTYPGKRLPHAWINTRSPAEPISTIDLAGHQRFTLITGVSGAKPWKEAALQVSNQLGVEIKCFSIGWKQDFEDMYSDWADRSEVEEDGCVLVRPDRYVAWRSMSIIPDPAVKLEQVMRSILVLKP